jgi:hypothetical protein
MSSHKSQPVRYTCFNDCRVEGCPGHDLVFVFNGTSDTYSVEIDSKNCYDFDEHMFSAMISAYKQFDGIPVFEGSAPGVVTMRKMTRDELATALRRVDEIIWKTGIGRTE